MRFWLTLLMICFALTLPGCDASGPDPTNVPSLEPTNVPLEASFSYTPETPEVGLAVSFAASASDSDGQIRSFIWDFDGDGTQDAG